MARVTLMPDYLADSNIWLRLVDPASPMSSIVANALHELDQRMDEVYLVPQVIAEFWRVATSTGSQRGGLGWNVTQADQTVQDLENIYLMRADTPDIYVHWRHLVRGFVVTGASVYDARLVAAMQVHGLTHILTFNHDDFRRYASLGIVAVDPASL